MLEILSILLLCYLWLFISSIILKDNSIVDVFWGCGFFIIAAVLVYQNNIYGVAQIASFLLIFLWAARISISILRKKIKHKKEDVRYAKWRDEWTYFYSRSIFQIYLLQMLLLVVVAAPLFVIFSAEGNNLFITTVWFLLAAAWLIYETIADWQVQKYIQSKDKIKNTIFTWWLWKYSRHPNYFWEIVFWLWITVISLSINLYGLIWFFVISFLLLFVSGLPLKENSYKQKVNYHTYIKETPLFIPKYKK